MLHSQRIGPDDVPRVSLQYFPGGFTSSGVLFKNSSTDEAKRRGWGQAAALVCEGATDIVDSNFGWSVNAGTLQKLIAFSKGWVSRRLPSLRRESTADDATNNDHPPCYASWPDYGWYAVHSPTIKQMWQEHQILCERN